MLTAEAHIETERPSRYLVQLCRHVSHIPARHVGDSQARPDVRPHAEWSDTHGIITLAPWGQCTMDASADTLTVRVEATDEDSLRRIQELVADRLTRYGRRDQLTVTWQRLPPRAVQHGAADSADDPRPAHGAGARRRYLRTIILTVAGALVVAVHLGLGGAALASARWTGWATDIVLVVVVGKSSLLLAISSWVAWSSVASQLPRPGTGAQLPIGAPLCLVVTGWSG
ncbi:MAG: DUF2218 domain-containing protein [Pseudonocardiaceae bacterium]